MKSRTGLFIVVSLALLVPSAWMMIGAPWAPIPESGFHARSGSSSVLLPDGRMLIVGGADQEGPISEANMLSSGSTRRARGMSIPRSNAGAVALADGRVLVTGGATKDGVIARSAEIYDPATDTWSPVNSSLTEARADHTASLLRDGRVVIVGGQSKDAISQSI